MKDNIFLKLTIKDGELHFPIKANKKKYENFLKRQPDGAKLELFIGVSTDKGSNPQLARIHACIREIATEIGYTFEEVKMLVKRQSGLCFAKDGTEYCKSFAQCDKAELNLTIQACIEIGDFNGMQLR
jgi:hypothetical protein